MGTESHRHRFNNTDYDVDLSEALQGSDPNKLCRIYAHKDFQCEDARNHIGLVKSHLDKKGVILKHLRYIAEGSPYWCVWMSETLTVDLNLRLPIIPGIVQALLLGVHCPPVLLTLHNAHPGSTPSTESYAYYSAYLLKQAIHGFCYVDFLLLTCTLDNSFTGEELKQRIAAQLAEQGRYFRGKTHLDQNMYETLKKAVVALVGCISIPSQACQQSPAAGNETLYLMERDWRNMLSQSIETLDKTGVLTLQADASEMELYAAMETVRRFAVRYSFQEKIHDNQLQHTIRIVGPKQMCNCFHEIKQHQTDECVMVLENTIDISEGHEGCLIVRVLKAGDDATTSQSEDEKKSQSTDFTKELPVGRCTREAHEGRQGLSAQGIVTRSFFDSFVSTNYDKQDRSLGHILPRHGSSRQRGKTAGNIRPMDHVGSGPRGVPGSTLAATSTTTFVATAAPLP